jgi:hypothetical protein
MSGPACMHSTNPISPKVNNYIIFSDPEIYEIQTDSM